MKKKLDNLIPDISEMLSSLNEGKALDISEELIEEFGENIKNVIREWSIPKEKSTTVSLRMSNIGRPPRQLWYDIKSEQEPLPLSPWTFLRFLSGHVWEEMALLLVKAAGHSVDSQQKEVSVLGIKGHLDCKIDGEVVDVKTASNFSFKKFSTGTLVDDDPFGYMAQLSGYEEAEKTGKGGFLAINKDSCEMTLFRPMDLEKPDIKRRIRKIKKSLKVDRPPDKCYTSIPDGKSGNMKLPSPCVYCRHKNTCHSDSNQGKGLRVFKYASKLVYFTNVVKEPRVPEVT